MNRVRAGTVTARAPVFFVGGLDQPGFQRLPACSTGGVVLAHPVLLGVVPASAAGVATLDLPVPRILVGLRLRLQAVGPDVCAVSNSRIFTPR